MLTNLFKVYLVAIAADFITGVLAAGYEGRIKSATMRRGLWTTISEVTALALLSVICGLEPDLLSLAELIVSAMLFKEGVSICENLGRAGMWLPAWLKKALEIFSEDTSRLPSNIKDEIDKK